MDWKGGNIYISINDSVGEVRLDRNKLTTIEAENILETFSDKEKLKITDLSLWINKLDTLPDSIKSLINLKRLVVSGNEIEQLPEWIGTLTKLEILAISSNKLPKFPESIGKLVNLKELNCQDNQLTVLPLSVTRLTSLKLIRTNRNQLPQYYLKNENDIHRFFCRIKMHAAIVRWILVGTELEICKDVTVYIAKMVYSTRNDEDVWE